MRQLSRFLEPRPRVRGRCRESLGRTQVGSATSRADRATPMTAWARCITRTRRCCSRASWRTSVASTTATSCRCWRSSSAACSTPRPRPGRAAAVTEAEAQERAARVSDVRVVKALLGEGRFALAGVPALTNDDIATALAPQEDDPAYGSYWAPGSALSGTGAGAVAIELTESGRGAFTALTRELAPSGPRASRDVPWGRGAPAPRARARRPDRRRALRRFPLRAGRERRQRRGGDPRRADARRRAPHRRDHRDGAAAGDDYRPSANASI